MTVAGHVDAPRDDRPWLVALEWSAVIWGGSGMAQRRGRRSHDDYVEAVVPLIREDVWKLKDQKAFAEYPGVKALALLLACEAWPLGIALHLLMAGAVADVYAVACGSQTRQACISVARM
jgi:hypothetical protein